MSDKYEPNEAQQRDDRLETLREMRETQIREKRPKGKVTWIILAVIVFAAAAITFSEMRGGPLPTWSELYDLAGLTAEPGIKRSDCLSVHFIDVGQGDCIYVRTPDGTGMLIDAGENGSSGKVLSYLDRYGSRTLSYVVATHPHSDHVGSLDEVISGCTVKNVVMPRLSAGNTPATTTYSNLLTAVKQSKAKTIAAKPGMIFDLQTASCTILSPSKQSDNLNDMSVVLRLDYGDTSFLFTGDAERAAEKEMLDGKYATLLHVDVLKLGHHGSNTSTSAAFLKAVDPAYAVISCGAGNDYGHPHRETMQKLAKTDIEVLRTDRQGSIRFYSDGKQLQTETDHA